MTNLNSGKDDTKKGQGEPIDCEIVVPERGEANTEDDWGHGEVGLEGVRSSVVHPVDQDSEHGTHGPHDLVEWNRYHGPAYGQ
jgi:hypothetical protein